MEGEEAEAMAAQDNTVLAKLVKMAQLILAVAVAELPTT